MFGVKYIKFDPMQYVVHTQKGKVKRKGKGLSFYYWLPNSSIMAIPLASKDLPFIFNVTTSDYQLITVQGQIVYKISEPDTLAEALDFTVNDRKKYLKDDFEKLDKRIISEVQNATIKQANAVELKSALSSVNKFEQEVFADLINSESIILLGVQILGVKVLGISPTPEMAKTLEAETREKILQEADLAIYERRNFSVEQERKIKESELNTEIAIEEKQKQIEVQKMQTDLVKQENDEKIRELKVQADIKIEKEKENLVKMQVENDRKMVEIERLKMESVIEPLKKLDWRSMMVLGNNSSDAKTNIALAFRELAENAGKIGTLNITPDLLENLLDKNIIEKAS